MTLQELILSVDSEQYSSSPLFKILCETKPEYGTNRRIKVRSVNGDITITNTHTGSLGNILTYPIDVDQDLNISKVQLLDSILLELSSRGFNDVEASEFWDDMTNLQKAKIIR